eukprot:766268-Hanusia_phi.AAC.1
MQTHLLEADQREAVLTPEGIPTSVCIKRLLAQKEIVPLHLDKLTPRIFMKWVAHRITKNPSLSSSTCNTYRSSLGHLFKHFGFKMTQDFKETLSTLYDGLKKRLNKKTALNAGARVTTGKDPLPWAVYQDLCKLMLKKADREYLWGRTFLIVSWNLMTRSTRMYWLCYGMNHSTGAGKLFPGNQAHPAPLSPPHPGVPGPYSG